MAPLGGGDEEEVEVKEEEAFHFDSLNVAYLTPAALADILVTVQQH